MQRVRSKSSTPLNGFWYKQPETGVTFKSNRIHLLVAQVKAHRLSNKLPLGNNLEDEIEQAICNERPDICMEVGGPSLAEMGGNFLKSMWRWAREGFPMVKESVFEDRKKLCLSCPYWKGFKEIGVGTCSKCGCAVGKVTVKLYMATEKCPEGKWQATTETEPIQESPKT